MVLLLLQGTNKCKFVPCKIHSFLRGEGKVSTFTFSDRLCKLNLQKQEKNDKVQ